MRLSLCSSLTAIGVHGFEHDDHLSGKPWNVREFHSTLRVITLFEICAWYRRGVRVQCTVKHTLTFPVCLWIDHATAASNRLHHSLGEKHWGNLQSVECQLWLQKSIYVGQLFLALNSFLLGFVPQFIQEFLWHWWYLATSGLMSAFSSQLSTAGSAKL